MTDQANSAGPGDGRRTGRSTKHRVPPRFAIRMSMWLRRSLLRAADRVRAAARHVDASLIGGSRGCPHQGRQGDRGSFPHA